MFKRYSRLLSKESRPEERSNLNVTQQSPTGNSNVQQLHSATDENTINISKRNGSSRFSWAKKKVKKEQSLQSGRRNEKSTLHGTSSINWLKIKNWYYALLDTSWTTLIRFILITYLLCFVIWSLLSWPLSNQIQCELDDNNQILQSSFGISFVFATSNILTLGQGLCFPASYLSFTISVIQIFLGLFINAGVFSVFVVKFQQPKPDIVFSTKALVTSRDGVPVLMFRVGNRRVNLLYKPTLKVALLDPQGTNEGERYVKYSTLLFSFPNSMTAAATAVHVIDSSSALFNMSPEELCSKAINVVFTALDGVYHESLCCTTHYRGNDIIIAPVLFKDMMQVDGDELSANFDNFDRLKPASQFFSRPEANLNKIPTNSIIWKNFFRKRDTTMFPQYPKENTVYLCFGCLKNKDKLVRCCPFSQAIGMILIEAGIEYDIIDIDWNNKPDWFLENTGGRTPCIYLNGTFTYNTRKIVTKLQDTFYGSMEELIKNHKLPFTPFQCFTLLETISHHLVFDKNSKKFTVVDGNLVYEANEASSSSEDGSDKVDDAPKAHRFGSNQDPLRRAEVWIGSPPFERIANGEYDKPFLVVKGVYRSSRLEKYSYRSQKIELLLLVLGINHYSILIDSDSPPEWSQQLTKTFSYCLVISKHGVFADEDEIKIFLRQHYSFRYSQLQPKVEDIDAKQIGHILQDFERSGILSMKTDPESMCDLAYVEEHVFEVLEKQLLNVQPEQYGFSPFLCGTEVSMQDMQIIPVLFYVYSLLKGIFDYNFSSKGFSRLHRYIRMWENLPIFRGSLMEQPIPYSVSRFLRQNMYQIKNLSVIPNYEELLNKMDESEHDLLAETEKGNSMPSGYILPDGSVKKTGFSSLRLKANTIYLAVGCTDRGYDTVRIGPISRLVEFFFREAEVPFVPVLVNLQNKPKWFDENTNGKCPNMYFNGDWTPESREIIRIVALLFPNSVSQKLPEASPNRLSFPYVGLDLLQYAYDLTVEILRLKKKHGESIRVEKFQKLESFLNILENHLSIVGYLRKKTFINGAETIGLNDVAVACALGVQLLVVFPALLRYDIQRTFPSVYQYLKDLSSRPAYNATLPSEYEVFYIYWNAKLYGKKYKKKKQFNMFTGSLQQNSFVNEKGSVDEEDNSHDEEEDEYITFTRNIELAEKEVVERTRIFNMLVGFESYDICSLLNLIEYSLRHEGPFLCGEHLGFMSILFYSVMKFYEKFFRLLLSWKWEQSYPAISAFLERVSSLRRFTSVYPTVSIDSLICFFYLELFKDKQPFYLERKEFLKKQLESEVLEHSFHQSKVVQENDEAKLRNIIITSDSETDDNSGTIIMGDLVGGGIKDSGGLLFNRLVSKKVVRVKLEEQDLLYCL